MSAKKPSNFALLSRDQRSDAHIVPRGQFLTPAEIGELTGKHHRRVQMEALNGMGIVSKQRADGSLVVLWAHVHQVLGCEMARGRNSAPAEPNWDGLNA